MLDLDVISARAAAEVSRMLRDHLICVTWVDPPRPVTAAEPDPWLVVGAARGNRKVDLTGLRIPPGAGIGGMVAARNSLVSVDNYIREDATRDFVGVMVGRERVGGAAGVPLHADGRFVGVLFAGRRVDGALGDRELDMLLEVSRHLGTLIGTARKAQELVELARIEERRRIATALHDDVTQLLFAVGSSARQARAEMTSYGPDTAKELERIECFASSAASAVRAALRTTAPIRPEQGLLLSLRAAVDEFRERTAMPVDFVVLDHPATVTERTTNVLLAVVREALANVAKHATGAAAVVSLATDDHGVNVVVQDDGPGLPRGFQLPSVSTAAAAEHFGLPSITHRVSLIGGRLAVHDNEDGGVTVRAAVPHACG